MLEMSRDSGYLPDIHRQMPSRWGTILVGLFVSFIAVSLLCPTPQPTFARPALPLLASAYLAFAALAGAAGCYLYWNRSHARTSPGLIEIVVNSVAGWVWIPAIVLFTRQSSVWAPFVAGTGAAFLAFSLRRPTSASSPAPVASEAEQSELFASTLRTPPREWHGPIITLCLYAEIFVLQQGWVFPACALLALAAFLFAWAFNPPTNLVSARSALNFSAISLRESKAAIPALAVTLLAMSVAVRHDIDAWRVGPDANGKHSSASRNAAKKEDTLTAAGLGGHVSIVLLTAPQQKQIVAPVPVSPLLRGPHLMQPLLIHFDGEYWYFQRPDSDPGPAAFVSRADPSIVTIRAGNSMPLVMQAHQHLSTPLPLECCRELAVAVENRDSQSTGVVLGVMLTDSTAPGKPSMILGEQAILSSQANHPATTAGVARETLRFPISAQSGQSRHLRQFDQIDFLIVPDRSYAQSGAKIAIRTLEFIP